MSEQGRDNGQEVRNEELTGLGNETLIDHYAVALLALANESVATSAIRAEGSIRNEILRRMSAGNPQVEQIGYRECCDVAICATHMRCVYEHEITPDCKAVRRREREREREKSSS